ANIVPKAEPRHHNDGRTLVFVGKDGWRRKGGPVLLRAFAILRRSRPDLRLLIAGPTEAIEVAPGVTNLGLVPLEAVERLLCEAPLGHPDQRRAPQARGVGVPENEQGLRPYMDRKPRHCPAKIRRRGDAAAGPARVAGSPARSIARPRWSIRQRPARRPQSATRRPDRCRTRWWCKWARCPCRARAGSARPAGHARCPAPPDSTSTGTSSDTRRRRSPSPGRVD